jgi:tetratricopeptide (TPR) repeat protein
MPVAPKLPLRARLSAGLGRLSDWIAPDLAAWCFGQTLAAAPHSAELHFARAEALARGGRWREAARSYAVAALFARTNAEYQASLALALERTGATAAAVVALRRFAHLRPGEGEVHLLIGTLERRCGRTADALRSFRLAVALGRASGARRFLLGEMMLGPPRWEEALAALGVAAQAGKTMVSPQPRMSALHFRPRRRAHATLHARIGPPRRLWPTRLQPVGALAAIVRRSVGAVSFMRERLDAVARQVRRAYRLHAMRRAARHVRSSARRAEAAYLRARCSP